MAMPETLAAFSSSDPFNAARLAKRNLQQVEACIPHAPWMIDLYMTAAADYRVVGRADEAVKFYTGALKWDRRPELFLQLGLTELELGHRAGALRALQAAILFDPSMLEEVGDPALREKLSSLTVGAKDQPR